LQPRAVESTEFGHNRGKLLHAAWMVASHSAPPATLSGIPLPIVRLNRTLLVVGVIASIALQQPLITTALFVLVLPAALFGRRGSPVYALGSRLFASRLADAEQEDVRLMRFNNSIAAILLGAAQLAFLFGAPLAGYAFSAMVGTAALVALLGFCLGCFLYFQFKLHKRRLFSDS
jgi:cation transporter-like permease